jgi:hypothetical protein
MPDDAGEEPTRHVTDLTTQILFDITLGCNFVTKYYDLIMVTPRRHERT